MRIFYKDAVIIMKKHYPWISLAACSVIYLFLLPTIGHFFEAAAYSSFSPFPLFVWNIISNLLSGAMIAVVSVKIWSASPTPLLLALEGLISVCTVVSLRFGEPYTKFGLYLPAYTMRAFFLGVVLIITLHSIYLYKKAK